MANPTETTKRKLLAASGNQCAFPECKELIFDVEHETIIGDIAHIKGNNKGSARFDSRINPEQRNQFSNLIVLCKKHHKIIDDNEDIYPAHLVTDWKTAHEELIADLYDDNWTIEAGTFSKKVGDEYLSFHYWIDKKGRPRLYSEEEFIKIRSLRELYFLDARLHSFLELIDQMEDSGQMGFLKAKKKELKLNEYGLLGTTFEIHQVIQDLKFLDYLRLSTKDGHKMADEFRKMGIKKIEEKKEKLSKKSVFRKKPK